MRTSKSDVFNKRTTQNAQKSESFTKLDVKNQKNFDKVIGIDISMGHYASTREDNLKRNEEVIRKYFDGKGHTQYTFSTGFDTKGGSMNKYGAKLSPQN